MDFIGMKAGESLSSYINHHITGLKCDPFQLSVRLYLFPSSWDEINHQSDQITIAGDDLINKLFTSENTLRLDL